MSMTQRIVILGAGGDAHVVAEAVRQAAENGQAISVAGFMDDLLAGSEIRGLKVLSRLEDWASLDADILFIPAIQKVRDAPRRSARVESLGIPRERWGSIVHPRATVARDVEIGVGTYIAASATVQPGCKIGDFASVRAGAALGHEAQIERHGYVGPNATMCGCTLLKEGAHLGPNAVLLDFCSVGRFAVVGIGTAVTKSVPDYVVVMGNPARHVGKVKP